MVKAFQVGKRYRSKQGSTEYLVNYVHGDGSAHITWHGVNGLRSSILTNSDNYVIVHPKPRTGKGYAAIHKTDKDQPVILSRLKWDSKPVNFDYVEIEWKEIVE